MLACTRGSALLHLCSSLKSNRTHQQDCEGVVCLQTPDCEGVVCLQTPDCEGVVCLQTVTVWSVSRPQTVTVWSVSRPQTVKVWSVSRLGPVEHVEDLSQCSLVQAKTVCCLKNEPCITKDIKALLNRKKREHREEAKNS